MDPAKANETLTVETTIGELTAAYFEAAYAEFGDEAIAAEVSQALVARLVKG